jgi:alpha-glucosidase
LTATAKSLTAEPLIGSAYVDNTTFANATIMGLAKSPVRIWLNEHPLDMEYWAYDQESAVLSLQGMNHLFPQGVWTGGWEIKWE